MTEKDNKFMSIHIHTKEGSSRDALLSVEGLYSFLKNNNISGTITDHGTIAAWAKALELKKKFPEIKIALGIEAYTNYKRDRMMELRQEIKKRKLIKKFSSKEEENNFLKELKELNTEFEDIKKYNHLVILAKNNLGLHNIISLNNQAYKNFYEKPLLTHDELFSLEKDKNGDRGLIITSACLAGVVPQMILKDRKSEAFEMAGIFKEEFRDDYYLEFQINGLDIQKKVNTELKEINKKLKIKTIISTDAHYESQEFNRAHEIFLLIQGNQKVSDLGKKVLKVTMENKKGEKKKKKFDFNDEFRGVKVSKLTPGMKFSAKEKISKNEVKYDLKVLETVETDKVWTIETNLILRNEKDIKNSKKELEHSEITEKMLNEMILNNAEIENKIEKDLDINRDLKLPRFDNEEELLKKEASKGLIRIGKAKNKEYIERTKKELAVINECGFASYFLILHDLFVFLKNNKISTSSGRGSSCGSLTAYLLGITRIDPLDIEQYGEGLVFERFLDYGRSGKKKFLEIELDDGKKLEFNPGQEIKIKRKGKIISILAENLTADDEII